MKSANCSGWRIKMNNENLSKNLCEICGIKPHYGVYANFGDLDDDWHLVTNESKCKLIAEYRYSYGVEDEDLRNLKPEYYPDFEQPENFVKLLELNAINGTSLWWTINSGSVLCNESLPSNRKEFLKMVCRFIKNKEYIKQVIKSQEWAYE